MKYFTLFLEIMVKIFAKVFSGAGVSLVKEKETESIISSHEEEENAKAFVSKAKTSPTKVEIIDSGGVSFKKFNSRGKKIVLLISLSIFYSGCSLNLGSGSSEPEVKYISERIPEYSIPERPELKDIEASELKSISSETLEKIRKNYDMLIRWGEALEGILEGYNEYALSKNKKNPMYRKME
jgi:hypothetical protein